MNGIRVKEKKVKGINLNPYSPIFQFSMYLRPLEPEDLELLYTIENDQDTWDVATTNVPYSHYDLKNYILSQQHDIYADKQLRLVVCTDDGRAVGLADLFNYSPAHDRAEAGIAILASERGRGYASEALHHLIRYAKDTLHLHQLYSIVPATNVASLTALRNAGFTVSVTLTDWLRTPQGYKDCIVLFARL